MKQLLTSLLLCVGLLGFGQSVTLSPQLQTKNSRGGTINKGDTVQLALNYSAPGNGSAPTSFYFDFQHQYIGYTLANITFPNAGVNGSALPTSTQTSFSNNYYPGYAYNKTAQNYTTNGWTNAQYANYTFNQNSGVAIDRISISYSAPGNAPLRSGIMAYLNFIPTTSMPAGYPYDSLYLDFVYGYTSAGTLVPVFQPKPSSAFIEVSAKSNALVNGTLRINSNLPSKYWPTVTFIDSTTGTFTAAFTPSQTNGAFTPASELLPNRTYKVYVSPPGAQAWQLMSNSIVISDYTAALHEFMNQTLGGAYTQTNIHTGIGYLASDVNFNGKFDGGDLAILFNAACGNDSTTIITHGAMTGINGNPTLPVFMTSVYDSLGITAWTNYTAPASNFVYYKTGTVAQPLNLAYVIPGDITRTYSSAVIRTLANGSEGPVQDASVKPQPGTAVVNTSGYKTFSTGTVNNVTAEKSIKVDVSNTTVTSNDITIPVSVNTDGQDVSALQFTFVYDSTQLKFNELATNVPAQWVTFVNASSGVIKFTTVDRQLKYPLTGTSIPFKLKFTSIGNGKDINTSIKIMSNMDAADGIGNQLGIILNSGTIKLTGYNNF